MERKRGHSLRGRALTDENEPAVQLKPEKGGDEERNRGTNVATQNAEQLNYPNARQSKINSTLRGLEQALYRIFRESNSVQKFSSVALGGNHHVFVHGIPDSLMKEGKRGTWAVH